MHLPGPLIDSADSSRVSRVRILSAITIVSGKSLTPFVSFKSVFRYSFKHLRTKLLVWMLAVVFLLTAAVLILVQARMRRHVREDLVSTLKTQSNIFAEFEKLRREKTEQTAALIANQSSLKALMSTNDRATVDDGSAGILETSHADLLLLEGPSGDLLAFHSKSDDVPVSAIKRQMQNSTGDADWWFVGGRLYDVSFRQITAGAAEHSRVLGRMALGREVSRHSVLAGGALGKSGF